MPQPALGAAAELPAGDRQVARALKDDGLFSRREGTGNPLEDEPLRNVDGREPRGGRIGQNQGDIERPGPMTTVPPPLDRRRIGTPSARQASTLTSSRIRRDAPSTIANRGDSQNRKTAPARPSSASMSRASSRARFSSTVARVKSRTEHEGDIALLG